MKKGTKVSWEIIDAGQRGSGITIADETSDGHILVAVENFGLLSDQVGWSLDNVLLGPIGFHPVIYCTVTWLTVEQ